MNTINSKQILFIHGAFVSYQCWDEWVPYFESRGYTAIAPPWPFKDADAKTLRSRHPDSKVASLRLTPLINYYIDIIKKMGERPIVIGHSLGGLMTQIIVNRGLAEAGVAIHSVSPHGIMPSQF